MTLSCRTCAPGENLGLVLRDRRRCNNVLPSLEAFPGCPWSLPEWKLKVVALSVSMARLGVVSRFDDGCDCGHVQGAIYIVTDASWTTSCSCRGGVPVVHSSIPRRIV